MTRKRSTFYILGGHTSPGQMSGIQHGWQINTSDMCRTIYRSQCVITTLLSDPRSTFIFSHWGSLLCLSAYAVEVKIHNCLSIVIFITFWCACYSAFMSETWSANSVSLCAEILSVARVKGDKILFDTNTLQIAIKLSLIHI